MDLISNSTIRRLRWLPCLTTFFIFTATHAIETKRFDAPPAKRTSYLTLAAPKKLRFAPAPITADRGALIMPATIIPTVEDNIIESNATSEESEFPVVDYADSPPGENDIADSGKLEIPQIAPPVELPLADPFSGGNLDAISSTDELMEVFDQSKIEAGNARIPIPFIPPYMVAPESMKISSRSTYKRVQK